MTRRGLIGGALAAGLACPARARDSHPPLGAFASVGGLRVHYTDEGAGTPVVLIHGASGNLRDFTFSLSRRLAAEGLRAVCFDRPGLGYSDRPRANGFSPSVQAQVLRAAAAQIGVERPVVVGHSWGGAAAMAWAVDAPDRVRGVLSLAGATHPWGGGVGVVYDVAARRPFGSILAGLARLVIDADDPGAVLERIFRPDPVPPGYARYVGVPLALRAETFRHNAEDLTNLDAALLRQAPRYRGLAVPVEAIHGEADRTVWAEVHAVPLTREVARGRLTLLPGVGHMPHHAREDAAVAAIRRLARDET